MSRGHPLPRVLMSPGGRSVGLRRKVVGQEEDVHRPLSFFEDLDHRVDGQLALDSPDQNGPHSRLSKLRRVLPFFPRQLQPVPADHAPPGALRKKDHPVAGGRFLDPDAGMEVETAGRQIRELLRERHRIGVGQPDDFIIRDMLDLLKALEKNKGPEKK